MRLGVTRQLLSIMWHTGTAFKFHMGNYHGAKSCSDSSHRNQVNVAIYPSQLVPLTGSLVVRPVDRDILIERYMRDSESRAEVDSERRTSTSERTLRSARYPLAAPSPSRRRSLACARCHWHSGCAGAELSISLGTSASGPAGRGSGGAPCPDPGIMVPDASVGPEDAYPHLKVPPFL